MCINKVKGFNKVKALRMATNVDTQWILLVEL